MPTMCFATGDKDTNRTHYTFLTRWLVGPKKIDRSYMKGDWRDLFSAVNCYGRLIDYVRLFMLLPRR